jgi:RHS repeat-associated protein
MKKAGFLLVFLFVFAGLQAQDTFTYEKVQAKDVKEEKLTLLGATEQQPSSVSRQTTGTGEALTDINETSGDLSVSLSGGASYKVPIKVPPGIDNVKPNIELVYNSQATNGIAGYGWNVSGSSVITRIASTKYHDNEIDPVDYDSYDRFALDGQRLILVSGTYGASGAIYETENHSNIKVQSYGTSPYGSSYGPSYFKVSYPDGTYAYYGTSSSSRSKSDYAITYWANSNGVYIHYYYYTYDNGLILNKIKYGGKNSSAHMNEVRFIYGTRKRPEQAYVGGTRFISKKLLTQIQVYSGGIGFKNYVLSHNYNTLGYNRLVSVTEKTGDNSLSHSPITFSYNNTSSSVMSTNITYNLSVNNLEQRNAVATALDLTGNGKMDFAVFPKEGYGKDKFWVFKNIQSGSSNYAYQVNTGAFENLFPVSWLTHNNKLLTEQGLALVQNSGSIQVKFKVYSNGTTTPIYYQYEKTWSPPTYTSELDCWDPGIPRRVPQSYISGDFNGDGLSDIIAVGKRYTQRTCTEGFGGGFPCLDPYEQEEADILGPTEQAYTEDNDVEKKKAVVEGPTKNERPESLIQPLIGDCCDCSSSTVTSSKVHFINLDRRVTSGFAKFSGYLSGGLKSSDILQTGDVNGDGKTDIIHITSGRIYAYTLKSNNSIQLLWSTPDSRITTTRPIMLGDYNGDGKTDFMTPVANNSYTFAVFTSTGTSFTKLEYSMPYQYRETNWNGSNGTLYGYNLIPTDVNGDGRTDIVDYRTTTYNSSSNGTQYIRVYNNTYSSSSDARPAFSYGGYASKYGNLKHFPIPIFISQEKANQNLDFASISNTWVSSFRFLKDNREEVLLRSVSNNGVTHSINYNSLDSSQYGLDYMPVYQYTYNNTYPEVDIKIMPGLKVVTGITRTSSGSPSLKQIYSYRGAVTNIQGLGFLGFSAVAKSNWHTSSSDRLFTMSKFDTDLRGALLEEYEAPYSINFTSVPSNYTKKSTYSYSSSTSASKVFKLTNTQIVTQDNLKGTTTTKTMLYDSYNNPTRITTNFSGHGSNVINYTYYNSTGSSYYIGRPTKKIETNTIGSNSFTTEEQYVYSGYKLVQKKTKGNGTQFNTEYYTYDTYGNIIKRVTTPYGSSSREVNLQYDSSGRFLTRVTGVEGLQTNFAYNTSTGTLTSETNGYGQTTSYLYDKWHRLIRVTDYLGKKVNTSFAESSYNYTVTISNDDGSTEISVYDRLKRRTASKKKNISGQWVEVHYQYDKFDRVWKESEPFTGSASQWNTTEYDLYGRIKKVTSFTGRVTNYTYSGLNTTINDGVKSITTTLNGMDKVVSVQDPGGTINYTYHGNGEMKTTSYGGLVTSTEIDGWGRKTKLTDPNSGVYRYEYNGFGETTKEISPKGTTTYTYSPVGKLTQEKVVGDHTNMTVNYSYNGTTKQLTQISLTNSDGNNSTYTYTYDSYKRRSSITEVNAYARFVKRLTYDSFGRIYTEENEAKYLSNNKTSTKRVRNIYSNGQLRQIKDYYTNESLYYLSAQNARGQITAYTGGNGLVQSNMYDINGNPTEMLTKKVTIGNPGSTTNLTRLTYSFNGQRATLNSRSNSLFNWNETFTYDSMDRLVSFNDNSGSKNHTYDSKGRITKNNRVGDYTYAGNSYKVSQLSLNTYGGNHYSTYTSQNITYNAFKSPVEINESGVDRVSFQYNAFMARSNVFYGGTQSNKLQRRYRKHYSHDGSMEITHDTQTGKTTFVTYVGGDGYSAPVIWHSEQTSGTSNNYYYLQRDYQGSIISITDKNGVFKEKRHFDAWGNIVKLTDGNNVNLSNFKILDRGYTGHVHMKTVGLIHMNARLYDPVLHRFLMPDNFVQDPFSTQSYNRYAYVLNNPLMYVDPSGEIAWFIPVIIGAVIGAYSGGVIANGGQLNPGKWDWSSGKTWGYLLGGALVGGLTGGVSNSIATSGVAFANTKALVVGSLINSIGTHIYTGGETDIMVNFGIGSFNFSSGEFGYLFKKGNSLIENIGYGLGAIANFNDFMAGFDPKDIGSVELTTEHSDKIGHSALVEPGTSNNRNSIVSFGPPDGDFSLNPFKSVRGTNSWSNHTNDGSPLWRTTISGVNKSKILSYGTTLSNNTPKYNVYFSSCVTHTSNALMRSGFFNIGIHPYILHAQVYLREIGFRTYLSHFLTD